MKYLMSNHSLKVELMTVVLRDRKDILGRFYPQFRLNLFMKRMKTAIRIA